MTQESKIETEIPFNEKTLQAYSNEGLEAPRAYGIIKRHDKFRSKFKPEKGPLQVIINQMVREAKTVFDDKGKAVKKDFLVYSYDVIGKDWLGNEIRASDVEGYYFKPKFDIKLRLNPENGEYIEDKELSGNEQIYTIELTEKNRKKIIEDIINKSTGSTIDNIKFVARFPDTASGRAFHSNLYTWDQFLNSSSIELERLGRKEGGPQGNAPNFRDKKSYLG